ncbi:MAG: sulfurtransferase-like selenium metabolism protein YedF [Acidobacteria bacterium]|nr:MAG: sulfurtransferase-like selenium metabolism protein YedF [Acidobacteriota bacterium]
MSQVVDAKGLACPQPVILAKKALSGIEEGLITVIVDSEASRENVRRFAESQGCTVSVEEKDGEFHLEIAKGYTCGIPDHAEESGKDTGKKRAMFIQSDSIGPDAELGKQLLKAFLESMVELEDRELPAKMIFVNRGVFVTCFWNETIEKLAELKARGVEIFSCGACLNFFKIADKLKIGGVGNAFDSVQTLVTHENAITLG